MNSNIVSPSAISYAATKKAKVMHQRTTSVRIEGREVQSKPRNDHGAPEIGNRLNERYSAVLKLSRVLKAALERCLARKTTLTA